MHEFGSVRMRDLKSVISSIGNPVNANHLFYVFNRSSGDNGNEDVGSIGKSFKYLIVQESLTKLHALENLETKIRKIISSIYYLFRFCW